MKLKVIFILLFTTLLFSRVSISELLVKYKAGDIDYIRKNLPAVEKRYPRNSNVLYLKGLTDIDGLSSKEYFNEIKTQMRSSSKYKLATEKVSNYNKLISYLEKRKSKSISTPTLSTSSSINIKKSTQSDKGYFIQLGAFSSRSNAENLKSLYEDISPIVKEYNLEGRTYWLVLFGGYDDRERAEIEKEKIERKYKIKTTIKHF